MDDIEALKAEIQRLQAEHDHLADKIAALENKPHGHSIAEFIRAVDAVRGGPLWGWRKDYAAATLGTDHVVTVTQISTWQRRDRVPDWAFDQIATLGDKLRR